MDPKTILSTPCDVLVPAAIGNVIDAATAEHIEARYVVEAANGPTTPEGDAVLRKRGITVLPDIYTNGGVCPHLLPHLATPACTTHGCCCCFDQLPGLAYLSQPHHHRAGCCVQIQAIAEDSSFP